MRKTSRKVTAKLILNQLSHAEMRAIALSLGLPGHDSLTMTKPILCKFIIGKNEDFMYMDFNTIEISSSTVPTAKFRTSRREYLTSLAEYLRKEIDDAPELSSDVDDEEDLSLDVYDKSDDLDINDLTTEEDEEEEEEGEASDEEDEGTDQAATGLGGTKETNDSLRAQFRNIVFAQTGKQLQTKTEQEQEPPQAPVTKKIASTQMSLLGNKRSTQSPIADNLKSDLAQIRADVGELADRVSRLEELMIRNQTILMATVIELNAGGMNSENPNRKLVFPKLGDHELLKITRTKLNAIAKQLHRITTETDLGESALFPTVMDELPTLTAFGWENGQPKDPFTGEQ